MRSEHEPRSPVTDTPFAIDVERRAGAAVVRLSGACTMEVAAKLGDCLRGLAAEALSPIVLEMSGLDFIESTGLGGIVAGYLRARRHDGEIRLVAPTPPIRELLELTRLTQLFPIHETLAEALPPVGR